MIDIDFCVSFGANCLPASALNKAGWRCVSGPFDWIQTPDEKTAIQLYQSGFKDFLTGDLFLESVVDTRQASHKIHDKNSQIIVSHGYRTGAGQFIPLEEVSISRIRRWHMMKCKRLNMLLKHADKVLVLRSDLEHESFTTDVRRVLEASGKAKIFVFSPKSNDVDEWVELLKSNYVMTDWIDKNRQLINDFNEENSDSIKDLVEENI
jgi:hypothetical protein